MMKLVDKANDLAKTCKSEIYFIKNIMKSNFSDKRKRKIWGIYFLFVLLTFPKVAKYDNNEKKDDFSTQTEMLNSGNFVYQVDTDLFSLDEMSLLMLNDGSGKVEYRFVVETESKNVISSPCSIYDSFQIAYQSISEPNQIYIDQVYDYTSEEGVFLYHTIPTLHSYFSNGYWLPNCEYGATIMKTINFPYIPLLQYQGKINFTAKDVKQLENYLNSSYFAPYELNREKEYNIQDLFAVVIDGNYVIFDKNNYVTISEIKDLNDVHSMYTAIYYYSITHPNHAAKFHYGMGTMKEAILRREGKYSYFQTMYFDKITSLNGEFASHVNQGKYNGICHGMEIPFSFQQIVRGKVFGAEIEEFERKMNEVLRLNL